MYVVSNKDHTIKEFKIGFHVDQSYLFLLICSWSDI